MTGLSIKLQLKSTLPQESLPKNYYNIQHDLPEPVPPPLDPKTGKPIAPEALLRLFAKECIMQEVSRDEFIPIPEEVREAYLRIGRPTPLYRATGLPMPATSPRDSCSRPDLTAISARSWPRPSP